MRFSNLLHICRSRLGFLEGESYDNEKRLGLNCLKLTLKPSGLETRNTLLPFPHFRAESIWNSAEMLQIASDWYVDGKRIN